MAKNRNRPRHASGPEVPLPAPRAGTEESPARVRLRQEQLHRAETRLTGLLSRLEQAEARIDKKARDANSMAKELDRLIKSADETIMALQNAIRFIASENTAEIIQEELEKGLGDLSQAIKQAIEDKTAQINAEFDHFRDVLHGVRDRQGKPRLGPTLTEIVSGMALEEMSKQNQARPKPSS